MADVDRLEVRVCDLEDAHRVRQDLEVRGGSTLARCREHASTSCAPGAGSGALCRHCCRDRLTDPRPIFPPSPSRRAPGLLDAPQITCVVRERIDRSGPSRIAMKSGSRKRSARDRVDSEHPGDTDARQHEPVPGQSVARVPVSARERRVVPAAATERVDPHGAPLVGGSGEQVGQIGDSRSSPPATPRRRCGHRARRRAGTTNNELGFTLDHDARHLVLARIQSARLTGE